jgi:hypothetical protein
VSVHTGRALQCTHDGELRCANTNRLGWECFRVQLADKAVAAAVTADFGCSGGTGYFENAIAGLVLDVMGGNPAQGTQLHMWPKNGTPAQKWTLTADGYLENAIAGLVLDVMGGNPAQGTRLHMWPKNGTPAQKWASVVDDAGCQMLELLPSIPALLDDLKLAQTTLRAAMGMDTFTGDADDDTAVAYPRAASLICVTSHWMRRTRMLRYLKMFERMFVAQPRLQEAMLNRGVISALIVALVEKAGYTNPQNAHCWMTGKPMHHLLCEFHASRDPKARAVLGLSFLCSLAHDSSDAIVTKLAESCDRVSRCESAKKQAYTLLVTQAASLLQHARTDATKGGAEASHPEPEPEPEQDVSGDLGCVDGARARVLGASSEDQGLFCLLCLVLRSDGCPINRLHRRLFGRLQGCGVSICIH